MKKTLLTALFLSFSIIGFSQIDTISENIYQNNGSLGIGTNDPVLKLHIVDSNTRILLGYQPAYDGPYINIYGSANEVAPMLGLGVANKVYYKFDDTLTMKNWAYLYGNNLNSGIAILPDLQFATNGIYINREGNVGINTKKPKTRLDVNGGIKISNSVDHYAGMLRWTGIDFEGYDGSSWLSLTNSSSSLWQSYNNDLYYNQGNIGIGTDSPENALAIEGDETEWPGRIMLSINNKSAGSKSLAYMSVKAGTSGNHTVFGHISETYTANDSPQDLQDYGILSSNGKGLIICATKNDLSPGIIKFCSGQSSGTTFNERMRIDTTGYIGIGTKEPKAKLEIADGDIYLSNIEKGIIMKSPDGQCWRGILDNNGNLNFTNINCPETEIVTNSQQLKSAESILVSPNPAENNITINLGHNDLEKTKYSIYNFNGQLIDNGRIKTNIQTIDISSLSDGMYLLNIYDKNGNKLASEKIIKK